MFFKHFDPSEPKIFFGSRSLRSTGGRYAPVATLQPTQPSRQLFPLGSQQVSRMTTRGNGRSGDISTGDRMRRTRKRRHSWWRLCGRFTRWRVIGNGGTRARLIRCANSSPYDIHHNCSGPCAIFSVGVPEIGHGSASETASMTSMTPACGRDSERSKGRCMPQIADGDTYKSHGAKSVVGRSVGVFYSLPGGACCHIVGNGFHPW